MPRVGLFFYGPDPGPCRSEDYTTDDPTTVVDSTIFTYDPDGHFLLESAELSDNETQCNWQGSTLVDCTASNPTYGYYVKESYSWGAELIVKSERDGIAPQEIQYSLSPNGYPMTAFLHTPGSDALSWTSTYTYENCRLVKRTSVRQDGEVVSASNFTYEYDAVGHMVSTRSESGSVTRFDYSCWSQ